MKLKLYRIKKTSDVPKSSSASLKLCHMCGNVGLGKGGAYGLWETGQLIFKMGPELSEFPPCTEGHHP